MKSLIIIVFILIFTQAKAGQPLDSTAEIFIDAGNFPEETESFEIRTLMVDHTALDYRYEKNDSSWRWKFIPDRTTSYYLYTGQFIQITHKQVMRHFNRTDEGMADLIEKAGVIQGPDTDMPNPEAIRDGCRRVFRGLRKWIREDREYICEDETVYYVLFEGYNLFRVVPKTIVVKKL